MWESIDPKNFIELVQTYQENEINLKAELSIALDKGKEVFEQLSNAYKEIDAANQIKTKLNQPSEFYGKDIFVNLGSFGWATYSPLRGFPYVIRNGERKEAAEGMPISPGDTVFDGDDRQHFHYLSQYESSVLEYYRNLSSNP